MDEDKTCNDECCEKRDEDIRPSEGPPTNSDEPTLRNDVLGNGLQHIEGCQEFRPDAGPGLTIGTPNRINDLVIKQMDLGYLVKVGCQTLCLESKERLIKLFTAYVNDPKKTMDKYYKDQILNNDKTKIHIGVIGSGLDDVNYYLDHSAILPINDFTKRGNRFEGEVNGDNYVLIPLTKPEHCKGWMFNKIIETFQARENKQFGQITELCNTALKS